MRYNRKLKRLECCAPTSNMIHGRSVSAERHSVDDASVHTSKASGGGSGETTTCNLRACVSDSKPTMPPLA